MVGISEPERIAPTVSLTTTAENGLLWGVLCKVNGERPTGRVGAKELGTQTRVPGGRVSSERVGDWEGVNGDEEIPRERRVE